ncbi:hypothetical protein Pd630_LPD03307 [Rhodococcus opacus PD630]|nr:hypothetical protein Pd630_LPD03307 [Rhodococcus opacus PD630]
MSSVTLSLDGTGIGEAPRFSCRSSYVVVWQVIVPRTQHREPAGTGSSI